MIERNILVYTLNFRTELILTPVNDSGKLLASLHGIKLSGNLLFSKALQIAQVKKKKKSFS